MRPRTRWIPALALALLPACGGFDKQIEFDPFYDFERLAAYDWKGIYGAPTDLIETTLRQHADKRLGQLGYDLVTAGADFRVVVFFDLPPDAWDGQAALRSPPQGSGVNTARRIAAAAGEDTTNIEPGRRPPGREPTMLIVVVDRFTFAPVWSGFVTGEFGETIDDAAQVRLVHDTVDTLLMEFPRRTAPRE